MAAWEPGWSALTWDDFTRVLLGMHWAEDPFLAVGDLVWLPLQTWVLGVVYLVSGDLLADNPMLGAALLNTAAVMGAAGLVGRAAWHLFRSPSGALLAFGAVLFSPWGFYTSLSGLNEPLYYLGVAGAVWGLAAWSTGGSRAALLLGSLAVTAAALTRYEAWVLVPLWPPAVLWAAAPPKAWRARWRELAPATGIALLPVGAPLWWLGLNLVRFDDPLFFAAQSARYFEAAFGGNVTPLGVLAYYPAALVRSAPLLLPVVAACALYAYRRHPVARPLTALVGAHLGLFLVGSVVTVTLGAFVERYLFAFVLALAPLLGVLPELVVRLPRPRTVGTVALVAAVAVTGYRLADPPREWTHAPDLLELAAVLGRAAPPGSDPLRVVLGPGQQVEVIPLAVRNGRRVTVLAHHELGIDDPAGLPPGVDLWVERLPARLTEIATPPGAAVGRYRVWGPAASRLEVEPARCGACHGWVRVDEAGRTAQVPASPLLGLEFTTDDPFPGEEALLERTLPRGAEPRSGYLEVRPLYGHGFNRGRITMEARMDDRPLLRIDIAQHSRWHRVPFTVPPGEGSSTLTVAVVAEEGIEHGWAWGRASTVLVRRVALDP